MNKKTKIAISLGVTAVLTVIFIFLNLSIVNSGYYLSLGEIFDVIKGEGSKLAKIIVDDNAKRVFIGMLVGAGLATAGCAMQAVFRNPLASPYILGLSSGASLGASIAMLFTIPFIPAIIATPVLAFATCFGTMLLVYFMSKVGGKVNTESLILSGVAVSALLSAIVSFLTFISGEKLSEIVFWSMGDLSRASWGEIAFVAPLILVCSVLLITQTKKLNAMMLGDVHAMDLGVDVKKTRIYVLLLSTIIVASAVSFVGVIGFVGLVIPHILRILLGPDNRTIMPLSMIAGATFVMFCSYIARIVAPTYGVLPIGVVTALIGAPFFIYLLIKRKKEVGWN